MRVRTVNEQWQIVKPQVLKNQQKSISIRTRESLRKGHNLYLNKEVKDNVK